VEDSLELLAAGGIGEYERAQLAAIELALRGEDARTEALHHGREARPAPRDHGTRGIVRVDDGDAELRETLFDGALAACDPSGEADAQARRHAQCRSPDRCKYPSTSCGP
jgi:hypothetical protein